MWGRPPGLPVPGASGPKDSLPLSRSKELLAFGEDRLRTMVVTIQPPEPAVAGSVTMHLNGDS